jgi:hypothetical protein
MQITYKALSNSGMPESNVPLSIPESGIITLLVIHPAPKIKR